MTTRESHGYYAGMYLRTTRRRNQDGSVVADYQRAETRWDPVKRRPTAQIIHNFGRADVDLIFWDTTTVFFEIDPEEETDETRRGKKAGHQPHLRRVSDGRPGPVSARHGDQRGS